MMATALRSIITVFLLFVLCGAAFAQEQTGTAAPKPIVTATATAGRVRYLSIGEVQQSRLQVFSSDGILVFDSSYRDGNLIDWNLTDQQGTRVKDGSYIFLVTVKDFSGRSTQKYGTTIVERDQIYLEQTAGSLSQAQATALESSKESDAMTGVDRMGAAELNRTATTGITTTGTTTNGNAAAGNQQSGKVEKASTATGAENISGTGTQNSLPRWLDNAGTLGDSSIYESNDKIGVGTTTPREGFTLFTTGGTAKYMMSEWGSGGSVAFGGDNTNGPFLLSHTDSLGRATGNYTASRIRFGAQGFLFDTSPVTAVGEVRPWTTRAIIDATGRFGLGIDVPTEKLDVVGNVKIRGAGNGIVFPDGTVMTTSSGSPSGSSIISAINAPATSGTVNDNRLSANVARLNSTNTFNANQVVNGSLSTTGALSANGLLTAPTVQSTTGGFKFPDNSVQTTAAGKVYTNVVWAEAELNSPGQSGSTNLLQLDLPPGIYMVTATIQFENTANLFAQNNSRLVGCQMPGEALWSLRLGGANSAMDRLPITMHTLVTQGGRVNVYCSVQDGGTDRSYVYAKARRFTAVKIGELTPQP